MDFFLNHRIQMLTEKALWICWSREGGMQHGERARQQMTWQLRMQLPIASKQHKVKPGADLWDNTSKAGQKNAVSLQVGCLEQC